MSDISWLTLQPCTLTRSTLSAMSYSTFLLFRLSVGCTSRYGSLSTTGRCEYPRMALQIRSYYLILVVIVSCFFSNFYSTFLLSIDCLTWTLGLDSTIFFLTNSRQNVSYCFLMISDCLFFYKVYFLNQSAFRLISSACSFHSFSSFSSSSFRYFQRSASQTYFIFFFFSQSDLKITNWSVNLICSYLLCNFQASALTPTIFYSILLISCCSALSISQLFYLQKFLHKILFFLVLNNFPSTWAVSISRFFLLISGNQMVSLSEKSPRSLPLPIQLLWMWHSLLQFQLSSSSLGSMLIVSWQSNSSFSNSSSYLSSKKPIALLSSPSNLTWSSSSISRLLPANKSLKIFWLQVILSTLYFLTSNPLTQVVNSIFQAEKALQTSYYQLLSNVLISICSFYFLNASPSLVRNQRMFQTMARTSSASQNSGAYLSLSMTLLRLSIWNHRLVLATSTLSLCFLFSSVYVFQFYLPKIWFSSNSLENFQSRS